MVFEKSQFRAFQPSRFRPVAAHATSRPRARAYDSSTPHFAQNFGDTLRRHAEHYHAKAREGAESTHSGDEGIASAHDRVAFKHAIAPDELVALMEWTRRRVGPDGLVIVHNTTTPMFATENFADYVVATEWGYRKWTDRAPDLQDLPLEWNLVGALPRGVISYGTIDKNAPRRLHRISVVLTSPIPGHTNVRAGMSERTVVRAERNRPPATVDFDGPVGFHRGDGYLYSLRIEDSGSFVPPALQLVRSRYLSGAPGAGVGAARSGESCQQPARLAVAVKLKVFFNFHAPNIPRSPGWGQGGPGSALIRGPAAGTVDPPCAPAVS